ncbi:MULTISPECIES: hypothetical protein [unclassified Oscillibacter]|jgi:hypothetical protein|uniref:hypothetical protein n=1 Tax=Oscillospiraceae TaxID=216572 RepID=UPI0003AD87A8|nr:MULTISPECIES: hypothetical protein [unclassified Oscillibacter]ERK59960.1 hypothetical protein HMPREF1545_02206 [Oscillibacter sp. KLE 1728]ERK62675.1 hypothetical protein HMPREF1546_02494 [Oscillibacter sp. KLE 1745]
MSSDRRRLNLSLSMQSPQQREAWKVLRAIPLGQRTDAVCRMVCRAQEQEALLDAVRKAIREELEKFHIEQRIKETERPQAEEVDESILGFLRALQEGDDTA